MGRLKDQPERFSGFLSGIRFVYDVLRYVQ